MIGKLLDNAIAALSPTWGMKRLLARASMTQIEQFTGGVGGYQAGKKNRLNNFQTMGANQSENSIAREEISRLRWASWDLYRNNPHARKIVRTIESKVIGRGMQPASQALRADGTPHVEFRSWAQNLWLMIGKQLDYRGLPGRGGQHGVDLQKCALRSAILSGETFWGLKRWRKPDQLEMGLLVPVQLILVHPERLSGLNYDVQQVAAGNRVVNSIELRGDGRRAAYWVLDDHPAEGFGEFTRIPAAQLGHLYVAEDINQLRGVPWFAATLMQMRDTGDYQYNELKASALAACVTLGVRLPRGSTGIGLQDDSRTELEDAAGNPLTAMQPGMILNLGQEGSIEGFNPSRPSTSAEAWIQHMIRSTAAGLPGVKASTLTGDYRNSSFSSERSADNDVWPELHAVQDWFACGFCQPLYEEIIRAAVLDGYFRGVVTDTEFADREAEFLAAQWQGPVALSINPTDDAEASRSRVKGGQSSPQIEAAKEGRDWREILSDWREFLDYCRQLGIPEQLALQVLGMEPQPEPTEENEDTDAEMLAAA